MGGGGWFYVPKVWTPSGGWWANPKHWKRNTGVAFGVIGLLSAAIFTVSASKERCPQPPLWKIPSQSWRKYAIEDDPGLQK